MFLHCVLLLFLPFLIVVDVVYDLLALTDVRNDVFLESTFVLVHISSDVLHRELYGVLNLREVLQLLDLVVRELVLSGAEDALITQKLLPLFLSYDLFGLLIFGIEA